MLFCLHFSILCGEAEILPRVASKLQTQNQQSEVHLETVSNHSDMGSSTACAYSSSQEVCMNHQTEPSGDPSI